MCLARNLNTCDYEQFADSLELALKHNNIDEDRFRVAIKSWVNSCPRIDHFIKELKNFLQTEATFIDYNNEVSYSQDDADDSNDDAADDDNDDGNDNDDVQIVGQFRLNDEESVRHNKLQNQRHNQRHDYAFTLG